MPAGGNWLLGIMTLSLFDDAKLVQGNGLVIARPGLPEDVQSLPQMVSGLLVAPQIPIEDTEVAQNAAFASPVAHFPVQRQGLLVLVGGLLVRPCRS